MYRKGLAIPKDGKLPSILTLAIGIAYLSVGIIQVLSEFHLIPLVIGTTDFIGGFLLIIVASVFLTGVKPLSESNQEGYAFIAVGYILAGLLFGLQILVILTNSLGRLLHFEDWLTWNILNDFTPSFWMFILLITGTGLLLVIRNMKNKIFGGSRESVQG